MPPAGDFSKNVSRGVIIGIVLLIIAILAAGFFFYQSQEHFVKNSITTDLTSISSLKANQIEAWRGTRLGDATVISRDQILFERANRYLVSPDPSGRTELLMRFGRIKASYPYSNVQLVDREGRVHLSLEQSDSAISRKLALQLEESGTKRRAVLTDLMRSSPENSPRMYAIAPLILTENGKSETTGAIILTIDPSLDLYPLIQFWPIASQSAETLLIEREDENVLFLNDLRHQNNTALNLRIPVSQTEVPAVMAVRGTTGAFEGRDYRGVEVISVLTPVPGSPWFLVTKIDSAEAYSAWQSSSGIILIAIVGSVAGVLIVIGFLWQRRQKYYYRALYAAETLRRQVEEKRRQWMEALLHLGEMDPAKEEDVAEYILEAVCRLTESPVAFFGILDPGESSFERQAWSGSITGNNTSRAVLGHITVDQAGIWAEAVRTRKPVLANDSSVIPIEKNPPGPGPASVSRFISIPIFEGAQIVMVSTAANRESGYSTTDTENLTLLMQGVWNHLRKRKAEEALQVKTSDLEAAYEEITAGDEEIRSSFEKLASTQQALTESERKYRNLYHSAQVGLFETSFKDATVVACNRMYADLAGFPSAEDAIGKDILHLYVNPDERREVSRILKEQGHIENCVVQFRNQSTGRKFWGQFSARYNYERDEAEGSLIDVTERKEAEEALKESETRLSMALEVGNAGVWEWNTKTNRVRFDDGFHRLLGYIPGELPGTIGEWLPFHNQEDVPVWMGKAEAYIRGDTPVYESEHRIRTKAGDWAWVFTRGQFINSPGMEPGTRFIGIAMNVTGRKHAEEALIESERKFRMTVKLLDEGYYSCTLEGVVLGHNLAFNRILGLSPEQDMTGAVLPDFWQNPQDRTEYVKELRKNGFIRSYTIHANTISGKHIIILASAHLVRDEAGRALRIEGTFSDITNLRLTETALHEEQEFSRLLLNASPAFYVAIGSDGRTLMMNRSLREALEYTEEEIVEKDYLNTFVMEEDRVNVAEVFQENLRGKTSISTNRIISKSGKIYLVEWHGNPVLKQEAGKPPIIVGVGIDITTSRHAEDALRESERRLREAQEMAHLGFWSWDVKTGRVEWSDEVYRIFGLDPKEFRPEIGSVLALSPWPEDQERDRELIRKAMKSREPGTYEQRFLRPDKSTGYYHSTFQGRYDDAGNLISIVGTVLDITQRKQAEGEIIRMNETLIRQTKTLSILNKIITTSSRVADRQDLLQKILEDTLDLMDYDAGGIYLIDQATQTASVACSRNLPPEFLASVGTIFIHTPPYDSLFIKGIPIITNHYDKISPANAEKTGFLSVASIPLYSKNEISGSINVISKQRHIITENETETLLSIARELGNTLRKMAAEEEMIRAEGALRKSEEKYRILFNRMVEGSALHEMIYDNAGNPADYRILDVNPAFESIIGIRRDAVIGKSSREAYGVDTPPYLDIYARVASTGQPEGFEVFFAPLQKHFSISVYSPQAGRFATIFEDITDRKQAEQQREVLIRELEKKNAELERFTYTVSHDLKSPLITIKGFAGMVDEDARNGDMRQMRKDLARITDAAETLQELLSDLLELSRAGKIAKPPKPVPFGIIAREAVDLLAGPLAERGIRVEIAPDLPVVKVDQTRIREVLINLIENAIKFSRDREDPVIRIGVKYEKSTAVFFIQDNGIGINPLYLTRIFNLFERLEQSVRGTGIGLPISRQIIEAHGGKIWAESEGEGKGTTLLFTLAGTDPRDTDNNNNGQIKE